MRQVVNVAADILREARSRRWVLALGLAVTALLLVVGLGLRLEVVDGALAATRLFGSPVDSDIRAVDVALRPIFKAAAYLLYYGGILFCLVACADFAPALLLPGRVEQLLALPLRRWHLLLGTFLGVLVLGAGGALYGAGGLSLILAVKTGAWTLRPLAAALLGSLGFAAVYACMLAAAVHVRSAAFSTAVGGAVLLGGTLASYRQDVAHLLEPGWGREVFTTVVLAVPRLGTLADAAAAVAAHQAVNQVELVQVVLSVVAFVLAALALGTWRLEQQDF